MVEDMIERARQNGLYDHRRITAPPRKAGWSTIRGRVARLRRREAPKVPGKQPRKTRPRLIDGACARLRPEPRNHARPHDVAHHRTADGRAFRTLHVLDEFTRERLAIRVARKLTSANAIDGVTRLIILRGGPTSVRSDSGPEVVADAVHDRIAAVSAQTAFIEPAGPGEND